jgi:8-oxo-dGTP pyrophosphatase MutT (NUDIX family)
VEKHIKEILLSTKIEEIQDNGLIASAVLLLLACTDGEYQVLFTKRSRHVAHHKGEIAFPGGTLDVRDPDLLHTALREGKEELGLRPQDVNVLGRLNDVSTSTTGFVITTYVATIPYPYSFLVNPAEIAEFFFVPLRLLRTQHLAFSPGCPEKEMDRLSSPFRYGDEVIWGATARILRIFLDLIRHV